MSLPETQLSHSQMCVGAKNLMTASALLLLACDADPERVVPPAGSESVLTRRI